MRLTFWELSWDVMEPICLFLTSVYFMDVFILPNTSTNISFKSFFNVGFMDKQSRVMKKRNFDLNT